MKPMLLNDKPLSVGPHTPSLDRAIAFLDKLPDNEVLDIKTLCDRGNIGIDRAYRHLRGSVRFAPYRLLDTTGRIRYLYGNPRAIKALAKLLEAQ